MNIETRIEYLSQRAFQAEQELTRWRLLALTATALCFGMAIFTAVRTILGGAL